MSNTDNTDAALDQALAEPASATVDGQSVTNRPVRDIIEADRYRQSRKAKAPGFGMAFVRMRPGSAVGE